MVGTAALFDGVYTVMAYIVMMTCQQIAGLPGDAVDADEIKDFFEERYGRVAAVAIGLTTLPTVHIIVD